MVPFAGSADTILIHNIKPKLRILAAPLDWGLGHTTRLIPVIQELLQQDAEVFLAGNETQKILLEKEFPHLPFLHLPGYSVTYPQKNASLTLHLLKQLPRIIKTINEERHWLQNAASKFRFHGVVSDNRYGLFHQNISCVFMTHQLNIKTPWGAVTEKALRRLHYRLISRFSECWIPDEAGESNLSGILAHPPVMPPIPCRYLGILTRFERKSITEAKGKLLILLSGPEPQRSLFEKQIADELAGYPEEAVLVRGLPEKNQEFRPGHNVKCFPHLDASELNQLMCESEYLISRSGYSTIMDALYLRKKCILIPTPGQTEQEYLARRLHEKQMALSFSQKDFSLRSALQMAGTFDYRIPDLIKCMGLKNAVSGWLNTLREKIT
ncbi:MAG: glycosyl transferase family 28 [Chitinophagaceae bacterium]|nr:glycosyl transferase family 28 [Chitinophagaceae bacterium]